MSFGSEVTGRCFRQTLNERLYSFIISGEGRVIKCLKRVDGRLETRPNIPVFLSDSAFVLRKKGKSLQSEFTTPSALDSKDLRDKI